MRYQMLLECPSAVQQSIEVHLYTIIHYSFLLVEMYLLTSIPAFQLKFSSVGSCTPFEGSPRCRASSGPLGHMFNNYFVMSCPVLRSFTFLSFGNKFSSKITKLACFETRNQAPTFQLCTISTEEPACRL